MDARKAAEQIDRNTVCLVGIAGTTEYAWLTRLQIWQRSQIPMTFSFTWMQPLGYGDTIPETSRSL